MRVRVCVCAFVLFEVLLAAVGGDGYTGGVFVASVGVRVVGCCSHWWVGDIRFNDGGGGGGGGGSSSESGHRPQPCACVCVSVVVLVVAMIGGPEVGTGGGGRTVEGPRLWWVVVYVWRACARVSGCISACRCVCVRARMCVHMCAYTCICARVCVGLRV